MTPRTSLAIALCLSLTTAAFSQQPRPKRNPRPATPEVPVTTDPNVRNISSVLAPIISEHKIPAMAAAIVKGDKTIALGVTGVRKAGERDRATIEDKWHLGSDTKAMTATLCGVLVEEGKLRWNMTLAEVFPDLAERMNPGFKPVTLEQLLTNRGGAPADLNKDGLWTSLWNFAGTPTEARRALLVGVVKHPPESAPGTTFLYSNAGFAIAGHMAEKVTGMAWEELMVKKVFDPLQMFQVGFGAPGTKAKAVKKDDLDAPPGGHRPEPKSDQPRGHRANGTAVEPGPGADNPVAIGPAGIVHCTIGDWAKFISLHLRGAQGDVKLLKADTFKKLHTPAAGEGAKYAMGWLVTSRGWAGPNENVLTHSGSNTMWYCTTWIAPDKDLAILIACNQGGDAAVKACDEAATRLIREATQSR